MEDVSDLKDVLVYFSDYFGVDEEIIEEYGAINISLISDLPLFIDPFLLFNSEDPEYQQIHREMIDYLHFLQKQAQLTPSLTSGMRKHWFNFSEVKQTWLGFSESGNSGRGMGIEFAEGLYSGLNTIFKDFAQTSITQSPHMEKLCLISPHVGRDKISDFTTNFAKRYLLEYTQRFAKAYLKPEQCKMCAVPRAAFNTFTRTWETRWYYLPYHNNDYVLLTPKSMLTKDDTFINRKDMIDKLPEIAPAIPDDELRFALNQYFAQALGDKDREPNKKEREGLAESFIHLHPEMIDYYLKYKEEHQEEATSISKENVQEVQQIFIEQASALVQTVQALGFYQLPPDAHAEAKKRVEYLKRAIEDQDCYKFFYDSKGNPIRRETDLQLVFRLVWFGTPLAVDREVNNGRGPADYKISFGKANASIVEFKLASNTKLRQNLENQVEIYKAASETDRAIKVIMYFTDNEQAKLFRVLNELGLTGNPDIYLIDARNDKASASNVK